MSTILQIQQEISCEFSPISTDIEQTLFYLIKQGKQLPPMPALYKSDNHLLKGCHSKVWLAAIAKRRLVYFHADSNTAITRGLIALLIRILSGQSPEAIVEADLGLIQGNCLERFIGNERSNGFAAMINQMKAYAGQFQLHQLG
jgi:cysteine desulfuration protein SufE